MSAHPSPAASLEQEIASGNALLQILQREQQHLIDADIEAISSITEDKASLVAQMTDLAMRRHRALLDAGFEASETGMQAWLAGAPAAALRDWQALLDLARQARETNRVNGLLIGQHMGRNQAALTALQGVEQTGGLYGPNGQSAATGSTRRLVIG